MATRAASRMSKQQDPGMPARSRGTGCAPKNRGMPLWLSRRRTGAMRAFAGPFAFAEMAGRAPSAGRLFAFGSSGYNYPVCAFAPTLRRPAISCFECLRKQDESAGRSATWSSIRKTSLRSGRSCSHWIGWRQRVRGTSRRCGPVTGCRTRNGERLRRDGTVPGMPSDNFQNRNIQDLKHSKSRPSKSRSLRPARRHIVGA